jgi:protein farnesyltransferase subunit beta
VAVADIVQFLQRCQDPGGGFGGGPGQLPHLAPSYAAVATLVTLGSHEALEVWRRSARHASLILYELGGFGLHARGFMYD